MIVVDKKARHNENNRKAQLVRSLRRWQRGEGRYIPVLKKPLRGAEGVYESFGIRPQIDVFVPKFGVDKVDIEIARYEFNKKKRGMLQDDDGRVTGGIRPRTGINIDRILRDTNARNRSKENGVRD